tara:strand:- start:470 stop:613 length:144 start_codon:yes stop_codon:yes gene_type:complete
MLDEEKVKQFLDNLLNPDMYGLAVTAEVRDDARELLDMNRVESNTNE